MRLRFGNQSNAKGYGRLGSAHGNDWFRLFGAKGWDPYRNPSGCFQGRKLLPENLVLCGEQVIHGPFIRDKHFARQGPDAVRGTRLDRYTFETCTSLAKYLAGHQPDDTLLVRMLLFWFEGGKPWGIANIALGRNILLKRDFIRLGVATFFPRSWWSVDFRPVCCL
jgi:hypothetical protein